MLSALARILLTSTSIAPVGFTYAWVAFSQGEHATAFWILAGCITLLIVCVNLIKYAQKTLEVTPFTVSTIEAADRENTAFLLLYLLPLFTDQFRTLNWVLWIPTLIIFAVMTATGYNYHFNPLIGLLGWHFYKVESSDGVTYVLITRKQLRSAKSVLKVGQLTEYILLDTGGK
jgi:hypothetical protein